MVDRLRSVLLLGPNNDITLKADAIVYKVLVASST